LAEERTAVDRLAILRQLTAEERAALRTILTAALFRAAAAGIPVPEIPGTPVDPQAPD
jgi:hypothetical protein